MLNHSTAEFGFRNGERKQCAMRNAEYSISECGFRNADWIVEGLGDSGIKKLKRH